jgi:hypothetical protein
VRNVGTPSGSGAPAVVSYAGRPTVREAEFRGGNRMPKKRMPVAERRQEAGTLWPLLQAVVAG